MRRTWVSLLLSVLARNAVALAMLVTSADWRSKMPAANWIMCCRALGSTTLGKCGCIHVALGNTPRRSRAVRACGRRFFVSCLLVAGRMPQSIGSWGAILHTLEG